jgi:multidrug efflux pump
VRNARGEMVPLAAFTTLHWTLGPPQLTRYNGFPSFTINGSAAPKRSSGEAMAALERLAATLPAGIGHAWSGQSFEERLSGAQAPMLFALSVLVVFLALAALYESWSIPFAVMLVVPLGVIGAVLGVTLRAMPNDIYFKVGLIATIGLSAKNAILIVEVAKDLVAQRMPLIDAARGRPPAAAADRDDVARVRRRRAAARVRVGRGVRRANGDRHRRARRRDHGHGARGVSRAAVFVMVGRVFDVGPRRRGASQPTTMEGSH